MSFYNNKKVLVTGGTGLIGQPLVQMLLEQGINKPINLGSWDGIKIREIVE